MLMCRCYITIKIADKCVKFEPFFTKTNRPRYFPVLSAFKIDLCLKSFCYSHKILYVTFVQSVSLLELKARCRIKMDIET